jgi:Domain of unknown function (DUF4157)
MAYQPLTKIHQSTSNRQVLQETQPSVMKKPWTHPAIQLQRTLGNRAVQRLIETARIHAQRQALMSSEKSDDLTIAQGVEAQLGQRQGTGSPLPQQTRTFLEQRLGIDLSSVRVHTGSEAHRLADAMNARAFTTGTDIFFREGAYNPSSSEGMHLLAHEVTHVLQQSLGPVEGTPVEGGEVAISDPSDRFEQEAANVAEEVMGRAQGMAHQTEAAAVASSGNAIQRQGEAEAEDESWKHLASAVLGLGSALGGGAITEPLAATLGVSEMGENPILGGAEAITGILGTAAHMGGFELLGAEGAGSMALGELGGAAAAGELGTLGTLGPAAAVAGAGLAGYGLGSYIAEKTGVDEAIGDELFEVLGPGPGLWLADVFGL